jgi:hypothetical protein
MAERDTLEKYRKFLFDNPKKNEKLAKDDLEKLKRIRGGFTHWTEFPMKSDAQIRDFLIEQFGTSRTRAYEDISIIKTLLGNVKNAGKEWHRYRMIVMVEETYQKAKDKNDLDAMAKAIAVYGKYTQLHIPESQQIPYDDIVPQPFEPSSDPSSLGLLPDPNIEEKIAKLKKKYQDEIDKNVKDVEYEMIVDKTQDDEATGD